MNAIGLRYNPEPANDPVWDEANDYALDLDGRPSEEIAAMRAYFAADPSEAYAFRIWVVNRQYAYLKGGKRPW